MDDEGFLIFKGRMYILNVDEIQRLIMDEAHQAPYSSHLGMKKMHETLKKAFFWASMKRDIVQYVAHCLEFRQVKVEHHHPIGLIRPHEIP